MEPMGKGNAMTSKLNTLLRMGLVSKNNVRRAQMLFTDPDRAMKNPAYRMLMQEILVDVVDRILNNKTLYATMRASLTKEPATVIEGVEGERTKTLLRSGLVKKKDIVAARRALGSSSVAKGMSASKVYRDMMIDMMDSMVKKITGSPVLFNAFKQTLGKEQMEESFEVPNNESMDEFFLTEDYGVLLEKNAPTNPGLWAKAKSKAKSKFDVYPSAYANGWAVKWYNEQGGGWKSTNECKSFFDFTKGLDEAWGAAAQGKAWWQGKTRAELDALAKSASEARKGEEDEKRKRHAAWNKTQKWSSITGKKPVQEANWEGSAAQARLKKAKDEYAKHAAEVKKPIPPFKGSTNPMARQDPKSGKMYWAKDRRKKAGSGNRRATDADYRSDSTTE